jgi:hypothetical protein
MAWLKGEINISRIPVDGIAGLGLVLTAGLVVYVLRPLYTDAIAIVLGGLSIGLVLLAVRHREARRAAIGGMVVIALLLLVMALWRA